MTTSRVSRKSAQIDRLLALIDGALGDVSGQLPDDVLRKIDRDGSIAAMPVEYA